MSLHVAPYEPMPYDRYFTPPHAVKSLIGASRELALLSLFVPIWECAAGAGHIAEVLDAEGYRVIASDIAPPEHQVFPVAEDDFLKSPGPDEDRLSIVTNPPYGAGSSLAIDFIVHALDLMKGRRGAIAMLLPFEFDARSSRNALVGRHPLFKAKWTVARRIRWLNLEQKKAGPRGHHAWYVWSTYRRPDAGQQMVCG